MMQTAGDYTPQWSGAVEGYARNFAEAHHWKVRHDFPEREDLLQECGWVFARCRKHFQPLAGRGAAVNAALFMAFFKRCLERYLVSLQRRQMRRPPVTAIGDGAALAALQQPRVEFSAGPLSAAIHTASRELQQVLSTIDRAPPALLGLLLPPHGLPSDRKWCRTLSRSWCRLARAGTVREDLVGELRGILR